MNMGTWKIPEKAECGNVAFQEVEISTFKKVNICFPSMITEAHSHFLPL